MRTPRFPLAFLLLSIFGASSALGDCPVAGQISVPTGDGPLCVTPTLAKGKGGDDDSTPKAEPTLKGASGVLGQIEDKNLPNGAPPAAATAQLPKVDGGKATAAAESAVNNGVGFLNAGGLAVMNAAGAAKPSPAVVETAKEALASDGGFVRTLARDPDNVPALVGHMQAASSLGDRSSAVTAAKHLLELDPANEAAKRTIADNAKIETASGVESRFAKLAQALKAGPAADDAQARNQASLAGLAGPSGRATALTAGGASPQASAGALTPAGMPPASGRGVAAGAAGPSAAGAGAAAGMTTMSGEQSRGFSPLVLRALEKHGLGDETGALFDITQAVDSNPNDAAAWTVRSEIEARLKNYPPAVADATKAIALAPENARANRARAFAELGSMQYAEALADSIRSIVLDPKNGLGYFYKALAEEGLGRMAEAASDLRQALALDSSLEPMAHPLMAKLGLAAPSGGTGPKKWLLRGGLIAASLMLVLFGMLGTQKGKTLRAALTPRRGPVDMGAPAPAELAPGSMLAGNYRVVKELGRGGMGIVYEGFDHALQRRVAIKRLIQDSQTTREDLDRFLREARLVAQLKHPNLAQIYNVLGDGELLLVFEYVEGKTLDRVLSGERTLPPGRVRRVVVEAASALACAHARGIIHRDLKPANVMMGGDGAVKLMDFGIAHQARAATQLTRTSASGTPPYMSPEQGMGSVSKASDLYALAVMAYELLVGVRPFEGPDFLEQKLQMRYTPITQRNEALPKELDAFFARAFEPDPTKRFADAGVFVEEFGRAFDATPRRQAAAA